MSDEESHYADEFVDRLETLWGEGFLSPGGATEVGEIVKGIDFADKSVLDIGCGTGGVFAASDWLSGVSADTSGAWTRFREIAHLDFHFATAEETAEAMEEAGFHDVSTVDRNAWYAEAADHEVTQLEGPLRDRIVEVSDLETYERWLKVRRLPRDSAKDGALRPTHLRGFKAAG